MDNRIKNIAKSGDYKVKEQEDSYLLLRENLVVKVPKTATLKSDANLIKRVVNEAYGFADSGYYGNMGNGYPYIEYKVIPLNHSLEQKVSREAISANRNKKNRVIHAGDYVRGKSKVSGKEYEGMIVRMTRDDSNDIVTVYVLSRGHGKFIPLDPASVRLSAPYPVQRRNVKFLNSGNVIVDGVAGFVIGGMSK